MPNVSGHSVFPHVELVPEVREKVEKVKRYIAGMVRAKNFFGWRTFVEELKVDIECEIYSYEAQHLAHVPGYEKEQGVGAYCNMAMQGAINYSASCSAQKRKINYEAQSLDALIETEKGLMHVQIPSKEDEEVTKSELLMSIEQEFGNRIKKLAAAVLSGEQLSKEELEELRKSTKNSTMRKLLTEE